MLDDLLPAEAEAYQAVSGRGLGAEFLRELPRARRTILERLISAVTREGLTLREVAAPLRPATLTGRRALAGPVTHDGEEITHPVRAAELLGLGGTATTDIEHSVAGYALALTGAVHRRRGLAAGASSLELARKEPSPLAFFEQWVIDGHPLQANAKMKLGLRAEDAIRYSPEWGATFAAPIAVLPPGEVRDRGMTALLGEEYGLSAPEGHALLPLHPWQAARAGLPLLDGPGIPVRPLMSFRTLAPVPRPELPYPRHLKTAVDIQLTGAVRGVSAAAAENGPAISRLLEEVLEREGGFGGLLSIVPEVAGCHVDGRLGAVARANPEEGLAEGELVMPVAALLARSPAPFSGSPETDRPIIAEVLDEQGVESPKAARRFAAQYARLAVGPLLTLLGRYGVALEAHPQNTLVVLRDGLPVRLLVRDLGAIRLDRDQLDRAGLDVRLRPGSAVAADGPGEARGAETRDKLYFSFFVNHLGELLACLGAAAGVSQEVLWDTFAVEAGTIPGTEPLFERPLPMKRMLSMRLSGAVTEESFVAAPNPMLRPDPMRRPR